MRIFFGKNLYRFDGITFGSIRLCLKSHRRKYQNFDCKIEYHINNIVTTCKPCSTGRIYATHYSTDIEAWPGAKCSSCDKIKTRRGGWAPKVLSDMEDSLEDHEG